MAVPKEITLKNGATLLYEKTKGTEISSVAYGFMCGSDCDPKGKEGLAHYLEHMLFKGGKEKFKTKVANGIRGKLIDVNAFTSPDGIFVHYDIHNDDFEDAISLTTKMFTNRQFSPEFMKPEKEVILEERRMYEDMYAKAVLEKEKENEEGIKNAAEKVYQIFYNQANDPKNILSSLGDKKTLSSITPQDLSDYAEEHFVKENLVISIASRIPEKRVVEILNELVLDKFPSFEEKIEENGETLQDDVLEQELGVDGDAGYNTTNIMLLNPVEEQNTIQIDYMLKARDGEVDDFELEFAFQRYEDEILNGNIYSVIYNTFRNTNNLAYASQLKQIDLFDYSFRHFMVLTSPKKINKCLDGISGIINHLKTDGVEQEAFELAKAKLSKLANEPADYSHTAEENLNKYLSGEYIVDDAKVDEYVKKMTYEAFNEYIKNTYSAKDMNVAIQGNFDTRKVYNIIELEEKIGKTANRSNKFSMQKPVIQVTPTEKMIAEELAQFGIEQ